jgi:hypothetical protein
MDESIIKTAWSEKAATMAVSRITREYKSGGWEYWYPVTKRWILKVAAATNYRSGYDVAYDEALHQLA